MNGGFREENIQMTNKPLKTFDLTGSQRIQMKMRYSFHLSNWKYFEDEKKFSTSIWEMYLGVSVGSFLKSSWVSQAYEEPSL